ncbi:hypothetical protein [Streptomyces brasiliscabiei]|uniref:hypothetical protein n=1 Tax=Streptomyces brasiliscabiei TaxID=2736302 RepID=UPI001C0F707D|nr:hypothetical protein [Streptomyces brasiliscabiei]
MEAAASVAVSALSLLAAISALYLTLRLNRKAGHDDAVNRIYGIFGELASLRSSNWQTAHLWELPEAYYDQISVMRVANGDLSEQDRARLLILERTIAIHIFGVFEQILYSQQVAETFGDAARLEFTREVRQFFTGRLLRNPRLVYLWASSGGGLCYYAELETRAIYDREVGLLDQLHHDVGGPFI